MQGKRKRKFCFSCKNAPAIIRGQSISTSNITDQSCFCCIEINWATKSIKASGPADTVKDVACHFISNMNQIEEYKTEEQGMLLVHLESNKMKKLLMAIVAGILWMVVAAGLVLIINNLTINGLHEYNLVGYIVLVGLVGILILVTAGVIDKNQFVELFKLIFGFVSSTITSLKGKKGDEK